MLIIPEGDGALACWAYGGGGGSVMTSSHQCLWSVRLVGGQEVTKLPPTFLPAPLLSEWFFPGSGQGLQQAPIDPGKSRNPHVSPTSVHARRVHLLITYCVQALWWMLGTQNERDCELD